jgi:hypothetical protein
VGADGQTFRSGFVKIRLGAAQSPKTEELQVLVTEVKPREATVPSKGVPVGTTVDYTLGIRGGEPEFVIEIGITSPKMQIQTFTDKSKSGSYGAHTKFNSPGPYTINILVTDKNGKTGRATVPVYVK